MRPEESRWKTAQSYAAARDALPEPCWRRSPSEFRFPSGAVRPRKPSRHKARRRRARSRASRKLQALQPPDAREEEEGGGDRQGCQPGRRAAWCPTREPPARPYERPALWAKKTGRPPRRWNCSAGEWARKQRAWRYRSKSHIFRLDNTDDLNRL